MCCVARAVVMSIIFFSDSRLTSVFRYAIVVVHQTTTVRYIKYNILCIQLPRVYYDYDTVSRQNTEHGTASRQCLRCPVCLWARYMGGRCEPRGRWRNNNNNNSDKQSQVCYGFTIFTIISRNRRFSVLSAQIRFQIASNLRQGWNEFRRRENIRNEWFIIWNDWNIMVIYFIFIFIFCFYILSNTIFFRFCLRPRCNTINWTNLYLFLEFKNLQSSIGLIWWWRNVHPVHASHVYAYIAHNIISISAWNFKLVIKPY